MPFGTASHDSPMTKGPLGTPIASMVRLWWDMYHPIQSTTCAKLYLDASLYSLSDESDHTRISVVVYERVSIRYLDSMVNMGHRECVCAWVAWFGTYFFTIWTMSSSSRTWSNPTFCGLCLALIPHTRALTTTLIQYTGTHAQPRKPYYLKSRTRLL